MRDRILELRRVPAKELKPHSRNWRTHPPRQRAALAGLLEEIGLAGALLARKRPDGELELIDGHLRAEMLPDEHVPVLVLDVTPEEANKLLATFDPISALAGVDQEQLASLLEDVETEHAAVQEMLKAIQGEASLANLPDASLPEVDLPASYQLLVECDSERDQQALYERLAQEGYACRVLTL